MKSGRRPAATDSTLERSHASLSLRVAAVGFLTPIVLMLAGMIFWPERSGGPGFILMSNRRLLGTLANELLVAVTLGVWLWRKGWRPHRTATRPFARRDLVRGVGVWFAACVGYLIWAGLCHIVAPDVTSTAYAIEPVGQPTLPVAVVASVWNALFEEFLWLGLGVAAMHAAGVRVTLAAAISLGLRVLVHAYQGPLALVAIFPLGAAFTLYYLRTWRLWPVVIAHALQDTLALAVLALRVARREPG